MNWRLAAVLIGILGLTVARAEARPPHKKTLAEYLGPGLATKLVDC